MRPLDALFVGAALVLAGLLCLLAYEWWAYRQHLRMGTTGANDAPYITSLVRASLARERTRMLAYFLLMLFVAVGMALAGHFLWEPC